MNTDKAPEGFCPKCMRPKATINENSSGHCFAEWDSGASYLDDMACAQAHITRLEARIKLLETERAALVLAMHRHLHPDRYKYDGRLPQND